MGSLTKCNFRIKKGPARLCDVVVAQKQNRRNDGIDTTERPVCAVVVAC